MQWIHFHTSYDHQIKSNLLAANQSTIWQRQKQYNWLVIRGKKGPKRTPIPSFPRKKRWKRKQQYAATDTGSTLLVSYKFAWLLVAPTKRRTPFMICACRHLSACKILCRYCVRHFSQIGQGNQYGNRRNQSFVFVIGVVSVSDLGLMKTGPGVFRWISYSSECLLKTAFVYQST